MSLTQQSDSETEAGSRHLRGGVLTVLIKVFLLKGQISTWSVSLTQPLSVNAKIAH